LNEWAEEKKHEGENTKAAIHENLNLCINLITSTISITATNPKLAN
tara:strand:+ start:367 stop:504 length:138 start_codon:yes stop_codon:yes gene_type:complete